MDDRSLDLVERWREGDEGAAADLFQRYAERLIAVADRYLSAQLRSRVDPEDVVQSACRSFFTGVHEGRYLLEESGDLWRLLVAITLHKVKKASRRHSASKRAVGSEQKVEAEYEDFVSQEGFFNREPGPEEAVILTDTLQHVLGSYSPEQRHMIEMRLQGYQHEEIAEAAGCCRQTVLRVLKRLRQELEVLCSDPTPP